MPTSVALGAHFEEFVKAQLASGRYNNVSEVLREGLRLLEDQERLRAFKLEALRAEIQKGLDSGPGIPSDEVFAELRARYRLWAEMGAPDDAL
jgi:antitoxin ParD1/3/4